MGYVLKAVLSSAQHPEYGQITVPFPIPDEKYDRMIELLEPLEIGDALRQDCRVDELDSFYTVLNRLVGSLVNFDELDYLAKRLDSFDDGEAAQFQGMACKLGVSNIKDFINLTFCCQQATVITDFSDLDAIGRQHYMTMQGGGCRIEELERLDGRKFALDLIPCALWNNRGCSSISKGCDTGWNGMGTSNTRHTAVAGLDPSGRNRSYPSSRARKGESCDGGKRPADKRQRPPNPG